MTPTKPFTNLYEETKPAIGRVYLSHNETFDAFCEDLLSKNYFTRQEKQLIKGLLSQWKSN